MRFRTILIGLLCAALALSLTACGGSKINETKQDEQKKAEKKKKEKKDEPERIELSGVEWSSGDLTIYVPDGWEVAEDENDWEANERIKVLESENIDNDGGMSDAEGSVYGDVYADIQVSDFSDINNAYSQDACENYATEYEDQKAIPKEYFFNDNCYLGYRNYGFVGDSAQDWSYLAYTADGRLIEIRAYTEKDVVTDKNKEAFKSLLASITVGGEPLSPVK